MTVSTSTSTSEAVRPLGVARRDSVCLTLLTGCVLALPALVLGWQLAHDTLGPNPLERVIRAPGQWSLLLLLAALAISPLRQALVFLAQRLGFRPGRRMSDWNGLIRVRRAIGLASFAYAAAHLTLYLALDAGFDWREVLLDLQERAYVCAGIAAFILLFPLALTSTDRWQRRLKRNWKRLHLLTYPAAVLAVLHFLWLTKPGVTDPYAYAAALALLLVWRIVMRLRAGGAAANRLDDEAPERAAR